MRWQSVWDAETKESLTVLDQDWNKENVILFFFLPEMINITVAPQPLCLMVCFPQAPEMSGVSLHDPSIPTFLLHLSKENPCKNTKEIVATKRF